MVAQITYQSLFKLYPKLSGMTGTAKTEVWMISGFHALYLAISTFLMQLKKNANLLFVGEGILENVPDACY